MKKTIVGLNLLIATIATVTASERKDIIISDGKLTTISFGNIEIPVAVSHTSDSVLLWTYGVSGRPTVFKKVKGLDGTDTNRTLIYKSGKSRLYFVDTIAGVGKVKLALITD